MRGVESVDTRYAPATLLVSVGMGKGVIDIRGDGWVLTMALLRKKQSDKVC